MKKLIREPLLHFFLLGAVLFGVHAAFKSKRSESRDQVVVTAGQVKNLAETFAKLWQRPPTAAELKGQIDQFVKEEMFSREAIKLGLDKNDSVIRRRLEQKMEFVTEDFSSGSEPTETELSDYFAQHPDKFLEQPRFTFRHVYLSPGRHGEELASDAASLLGRLQTPGFADDVSTLGDPLLLPAEFSDQTQSRVEATFGREFAAELAKLKPGEWSGPVRSSYGVHLVIVDRHIEGRLPALSDVRAAVIRELVMARRETANQKFLEALLAKYQVTIDWPRLDKKTDAQTTAMNP